METPILFSAYRAMWLIVMFDLPTKTQIERKIYTKFRDSLMDDWFQMIQFSIYVRFCPSIDNLNVHIKRVKEKLPPEWEIRILTFTDKQYWSMQVFNWRNLGIAETPPNQISMF